MSSSSLTAYFVTASVARLGAGPRWRNLVDPEARALAEAFTRHAPDAPVKRLLSRAPAVALVGLTEAFFVPGMAYHYLFRKRLIELEARRAIARGVRQILVLGAGFDSLSLRLAKAFPEIIAVEIDLPRTQSRKRVVLGEIGHEVPTNCHFVAADLSERTLDDVLASTPAVRADLPTLVVIEGVLMYLRASEVRSLFAALHRRLADDLSVVFGAIAAPDTDGGWRLRLVNRLLGQGGEGTHWACPADGMPAFLAPLGFTLERAVRYRAMQREHRSASETRRVPEDDENYYLASRAR